MCKQSYYGRTKCGDSISRFHPEGKLRRIVSVPKRGSCVNFQSNILIMIIAIFVAEIKSWMHGVHDILVTVWFVSTETVKIAGYFAIVGTLSLAVFCILSIVQLAMVVSKEKVVIAYSKTVVTKLVFAFAASKYYGWIRAEYNAQIPTRYLTSPINILPFVRWLLSLVSSTVGHHRSRIVRSADRRQRQQLPSDQRRIVLYAGKRLFRFDPTTTH